VPSRGLAATSIMHRKRGVSLHDLGASRATRRDPSDISDAAAGTFPISDGAGNPPAGVVRCLFKDVDGPGDDEGNERERDERLYEHRHLRPP
jgi:hypothetical protein